MAIPGITDTDLQRLRRPQPVAPLTAQPPPQPMGAGTQQMPQQRATGILGIPPIRTDRLMAPGTQQGLSPITVAAPGPAPTGTLPMSGQGQVATPSTTPQQGTLPMPGQPIGPQAQTQPQTGALPVPPSGSGAPGPGGLGQSVLDFGKGLTEGVKQALKPLQPLEVKPTKPKEETLTLPGAGQEQVAKPPTTPQEGTLPAAGAEGQGQVVTPPTTPQEGTLVPPGQGGQFSNSLDNFAQVAQQWMQGTDDKIFRAAVNQVVQDMGLMNQAERDALQMRINQDPNLKGQGAGVALLSMLTRDQNFRMDQVLGKLSVESMQRILDLQKYGFEAGIKVNQIRRDRQMQDVEALIKSGNYDAAAKLMNEVFGAEYGGLGLNFSAEELKKRDPLALSQFQEKMQMVKDIARTNPKAAIELLRSIMANPANAGWFPEGAKPEDLIAALTNPDIAANLGSGRKIGEEINAIAFAGQSFMEAAGLYPEYFKFMGRNAVTEGRRLSLEEVNALRAKDKLPPITADEFASFDDEDFKQLAYMKDYYDRVDKSKEAPWQRTYDNLIRDYGTKFLNEEFFKGGRDALKDVLVMVFNDPANFKQDPDTGAYVPDPDAFQLPWKNPDYYHLFYSWPTASWTQDQNGNWTIALGPDGKPAYDKGGDVYGDNNRATPEDEALDGKYSAYVSAERAQNRTPLSAPEWYFATAGGKTDPNKARIPEDVKPSGGSGLGSTGGMTAEAWANLNATDRDAKIKDQAFVDSAMQNGILTNYTISSRVPNTEGAWLDLIKNNGGYIAINGKGFKVTKPYHDTVTDEWYVKIVGSDGKEYWLDIYKKPGMVYDPSKGGSYLSQMQGVKIEEFKGG